MQPKLKIISEQRKKEPTHHSLNKHPTPPPPPPKKKKKSKEKKEKVLKSLMILKADKKQTMVFSKTQYHANKRYQIKTIFCT